MVNQQVSEQATMTAGFAPNQQVSICSKYAVPSQTQMEVGEENHANESNIGGDVLCPDELTLDDEGVVTDNSDSRITVVCGQGKDTYHDFMHIYQDLCKMTSTKDHNDSVCRVIMMEYMNSARSQIFTANVV